MSRLSRFVQRHRRAAHKFLWGLANSHAPDARALYILGAQRSGTTLLLDCFEKSFEFDVRGESSNAMVDFRIRGDDEIRKIIRTSRHKTVVFKPLTDAHRAREFLELTPNSVAVWAFRRAEDRANSATAKFGDHNLQILREFSKGEGLDRWQAQGFTDETLDVIRSFDYTDMTPESAAAIFWYVRNSLFFSNALDELDTVLPLAYENLVAEPEITMRGVCKFVGGEFKPAMIRNVHARSVGRSESRVAENVVSLCDPMYEKLLEAQSVRWQSLDLGDGRTGAPHGM